MGCEALSPSWKPFSAQTAPRVAKPLHNLIHLVTNKP
jgi:hypothetical protein